MTAQLRRRVFGAFIGLILGVASITACTNNNDVVARVGDKSITVAAYNSAINDAYADPVIGGDAKKQGPAYRTNVLRTMLQSLIIEKIAADKKIVPTTAELKAFEDTLFGGSSDAELQQQLAAQGQLYTIPALHQTARIFYLESELGRQAIDKPESELQAEALKTLQATSTTYDLKLISVPDQATSDQYLASLKAGKTTMAQIGSEIGPAADGTPQPLDQPAVDPSQLPPDVAAQIKATPEGGYLVISTSGAFYLAQVSAVTVTPVDQLQAKAADQVNTEISTQGQKTAGEIASKMTIYVNARYGTLQTAAGQLPSITNSDPGTFQSPPAKSSAPAPAPAPAPAAAPAG